MPDHDNPGRGQTGSVAPAPEPRSFKSHPKDAADKAGFDTRSTSTPRDEESEITRPSRFRPGVPDRP